MIRIKDKIWFLFIRQHLKRSLLLITAGFAANYVTLLLTLSVGKFLQLTTGAGSGKSKALQMLGIHLSDDYFIFFQFFFLLILLRFLITWLYNFHLSVLGEVFTGGLRLQLFKHQLQQATRQKPRASALLAYSNEAKTLQRLLTRGVIGFIKELLFIAMAFYLLFSLSHQLTLWLVFLLLLSFAAYRKWARMQKPATQEKNKYHSDMLAFVSSALLTGPTGKANNINTFAEKNDNYQQSVRRLHLRQSLLNVIAPALLYGILGLVMIAIFYTEKKVIQEKTDIVIYILLLLSITPSLRSIIKIQNTWTKGRLASRRYKGIQMQEKATTPPTVSPALYKV